MALAGYLLRAGAKRAFAEELVYLAAAIARDPEADDRRRAVASTADALRSKKEVTGIPSLRQYLPEAVVGKVVDWLGFSPGCQAIDAESPAKPAPHPSTADRLVAIGRACDLFHSDRFEAFARYDVGEHQEIRPLRSKEFKTWLRSAYYHSAGKTAGAQAVEDAIATLEGFAGHEGDCRRLAVRVSRDRDQSIWIDLSDAEWRAVHVTPDGWQVVNAPPAVFRRYATCDAQVEPARAGSVDELRPFVNVASDDVWRLLVAWIVAALVPDIPHPVLVIHGEQGTAKSTTARILAALIDPSIVPLRSEPGNLGEWIQAADHSYVVALDNVSNLPDWLSDALCRAVTGDGFTKRQLYSDNDDVVYAFRRVTMLTGIEVVAQRADLLDRAILLALDPIASDKRRLEADVMDSFASARAPILGGVLDVLAGVLRVLPEVRMATMPRMADFARIGVAVEQVLRWPHGSFLAAYDRNSRAQNDEAISASPVAEAILEWLPSEQEWEGTCTALLDRLASRRGDGKRAPDGWPKSARALSGALRRVVPNLRQAGVSVEFARNGTTRQIRLRYTDYRTVTTVTSSQPNSECVTVEPGSVTQTLPAMDEPSPDGHDGSDGGLRAQSDFDDTLFGQDTYDYDEDQEEEQ
jgi:hypothetical protein